MNRRYSWLALVVLAAVLLSVIAWDGSAPTDYTPQLSQAGKDVIWVPTPPALVETMLDMAKVAPDDYVIDLGSGDGRIVIGAARRGARALGIELNADLVELSKRKAEKEGVGSKASFVKADIFESDFSQATVITIYLLPHLNHQLRPRFLALRPGTRIVSNSFYMPDWKADGIERVVSIKSFFAPALRRIEAWVPKSVIDYVTDYGTFVCTAYLWIVPAKVEGAWQWPQSELNLSQKFQVVEGTLKIDDHVIPIGNGRVHGTEISFSAGGAVYHGQVRGPNIEGSIESGGKTTSWRATLRVDDPGSIRAR